MHTVPKHIANIGKGRKRYTLSVTADEFAELISVMDACVVEEFADGSMVLTEWQPMPDLLPGVYPLPIAA